MFNPSVMAAIYVVSNHVDDKLNPIHLVYTTYTGWYHVKHFYITCGGQH
jgi:hypothetical protein